MDKKRVIDELTQGIEFAKQLQIHLNSPSSSQETQEILMHNILSSYDKLFSLLAATPNNANGNNEESYLHSKIEMETRITGLEAPCLFNESTRSEDSNCDVKDIDHKNLPTKRKNRNIEKWKCQVKADGDLDDGYSWRKYGQKDILGAKHPRGYYRCNYHQIQGCFATKQVQRTDDDPNIFDITYRGRHTCNPSSLTTSSLPSSTPPVGEIQLPFEQNQPFEENQLSQPSKIPLNFETSLNVKTENLNTNPFQFPFISNNNLTFSTLDNPFNGDMSPSFIFPTTTGSTYFTESHAQMSGVEGKSNVIVDRSKLNNVVSTATPSTSSFTVDVGFTVSEPEHGNIFNFDDSIFFD